MADANKKSIWDRVFETTEEYKSRVRAEAAKSKAESQSRDNQLNQDKQLPLSERMRLLQKGATGR